MRSAHGRARRAARDMRSHFGRGGWGGVAPPPHYRHIGPRALAAFPRGGGLALGRELEGGHRRRSGVGANVPGLPTCGAHIPRLVRVLVDGATGSCGGRRAASSGVFGSGEVFKGVGDKRGRLPKAAEQKRRIVALRRARALAADMGVSATKARRREPNGDAREAGRRPHGIPLVSRDRCCPTEVAT